MFHRFTRKKIFVITLTLLFLALLCSAVLINASGSRASAASTLGSAAAAKGRVFGAAVEANLLGTTPYTTVFDREFSGTTPGNEMKWQTTEPTQGTFNFAPADTIVSHAQSHNMKIRGHTLVWHSQLASWVSSITSGSALLAAMRNHITVEMTHFKGQLWYWDVVNEAFNDDGTRRSDIFQNEIGNSYIEDAFVAARAADPNVKLCYNDYNIEGVNAKSTAVYNMVRDFQARGIPIDCVGFQSHLIVGQVPSDFQANLQRFAALGLDVQVTELDIRMPTPASSANLQQQATDYSKVVSACLAVSRCNDITVWGVGDPDSWIPGVFSGQGAALLFDNNYNPKPAYNAVIQTLGGSSGTPTPTPTSTSTPTPTPTQGAGAHCNVHYTITNQWQTGFGATFVITNTGTTAINGWSLQFAFANGQTITQLWNGNVSQSGSVVTITNVSYNGSIPAGSALSSEPGFNGTWNGTTNAAPTAFTLNGATCSTS
ncbi:MAG TPA: endo-1,4-beta-xylanase [Ktedonosporobacter sp.]|nr:endo-1,4-beta-xylanase [Ktedonosporobacter sp.]